MQCPKCDAMMNTKTIDEIEIDQCMGCGGLWFDLREHDHLLASEDTGAAELDSGDRKQGEANNDVRDIDCPRCQVAMGKLRHHEQTHIEYEQCAMCGGVYLDAGEFEDLRNLTLVEKVRQMLPGLRRR